MYTCAVIKSQNCYMLVKSLSDYFPATGVVSFFHRSDKKYTVCLRQQWLYTYMNRYLWYEIGKGLWHIWIRCEFPSYEHFSVTNEMCCHITEEKIIELLRFIGCQSIVLRFFEISNFPGICYQPVLFNLEHSFNFPKQLLKMCQINFSMLWKLRRKIYCTKNNVNVYRGLAVPWFIFKEFQLSLLILGRTTTFFS